MSWRPQRWTDAVPSSRVNSEGGDAPCAAPFGADACAAALVASIGADGMHGGR